MNLDEAIGDYITLAAEHGGAATCLIVADPAQAGYVLSQVVRFSDQAGDLGADGQTINVSGGGWIKVRTTAQIDDLLSEQVPAVFVTTDAIFTLGGEYEAQLRGIACWGSGIEVEPLFQIITGI